MGKRNFLCTAIDNNGIEQTMHPIDWALHPDTKAYSHKLKRFILINGDYIKRNISHKMERGLTDREIVGLDIPKDWSIVLAEREAKKRRIDEINRENTAKALTNFNNRKLA